MKIGLGSDHGGFKLKAEVKKHLEEKGFECIDYGTNSEDSVDYPDYGKKVGEAVVSGDCDKAIVCCGTGIGISIAANKVNGVRCALCGDTFSARMASEHNNANMIALGERVLGVGLALDIVDAWIEAEFAGGRHGKRVDKIMAIEEN